ncbi:MAG: pyridoxal phosphate-dependent aminotransferase family protein [Bacteroidota bacterium]
MGNIQQRLQKQLDERMAAGNLRKLSVIHTSATFPPIDFCSNDYLGLARNEALRQRIEKKTQAITCLPNGATGSRLISGNSLLAQETEAELARIFQAESCLVFNSGYAANSAVLATIPQKGDIILCDELIHASLREGARLSYAQRYSFRHNDLHDLEKKIQHARKNGQEGEIFIVAEAVYSMDGDFGPLQDLLAVCLRYEAHLIWDEAHSTGIWGERGSGLSCAWHLQEQIFARIYTFGKAMGVHGACVAGSAALTSYLTNFARGFIYTTALPPHSLISIRESFSFLAENAFLPQALLRKISLFTDTLKENSSGLPADSSQSPIQIIKVGGNAATKQLAQHLQKAGFDVRAILSPTVKTGEERLRICLHVYNTDAEITQLATLLKKEVVSR